MSFCVYSGLGNQFVMFYETSPNIFVVPSIECTQTICAQENVDGVIYILHSNNPKNVRMRIFNSADGREAEMCGNGLRCVVRYLYDHHHLMEVDVTVGREDVSPGLRNVACSVIANDDDDDDVSIRADLGPPITPMQLMPSSSLLPILSSFVDIDIEAAYFGDTGVPHLVLFLKQRDMFEADGYVERIGREHRYHHLFEKTNGTNVNFVIFGKEKTEIFVRTYERGVERETMACGTGCMASALSAHTLSMYNHERSNQEYKCRVKSGETLRIEIHGDENRIVMTGGATRVR